MVLVLAAALGLSACKKKEGADRGRGQVFDLSDPKAAAVTFAKALEAGDLATARLASNASGFEGELLEAMAESSSGMSRLTTAASGKLGEEARRLAEQHAGIGIASLIANGNVDQQGDRATVRSKDGRSVQLQRIDGKWRVDVGALSKGQDVSQVVQFLRAAGLAARQVADDIEAGRVASLPEVQDAMLGRVMANLPRRLRDRMIRRPLSATTSSTQTS
jgi:hypothetical protein